MPNPEAEKGGVLADFGLTEEQGNQIIMAARAHWFADEPASGEVAPAVGLTADQVTRAFQVIDSKREAARYLHAGPVLFDPEHAS